MQRDFLSPDGYFARQGYDPAPRRAVLPVLGRLMTARRDGYVEPVILPAFDSDEWGRIIERL